MAEYTQADHIGDCTVAGLHSEGEVAMDKVVEEDKELDGSLD